MIEQIRELIYSLNIDLSDWKLEIILVLSGLVLVLLLVVAIRDNNRFVTREYYFCATGLKKNAKLLVISDLHNKQYGKNNHALWNAIELIAPDYVVIAGDLVTAYSKDNTTACELLRLLASKYPVYYGNGNHEHRVVKQAATMKPVRETNKEAAVVTLSTEANKESNNEESNSSRRIRTAVSRDSSSSTTMTAAAQLEQVINELPIARLQNESIHISDINMNIFGLDMDYDFYRRFSPARLSVDYIDELIGAPEEGAVNLLIAHNPDYFPGYAAWGADLVVSGHLHGGLIRLPLLGGLISPRFRLFPRYDGGLFSSGKSTMVVSRGLGGNFLQVRMRNPGELVVIHMRH
ncbi:MAG: metallophosphoesterase [Lachnospiraceae bacterium]|jgi:predicted MPP superfamily phosphohydrolase|nr:metallophosphoesterase [Lachnospiraceae bacterium]